MGEETRRVSSSHQRPLGRKGAAYRVRAFSFPNVGLTQAGQHPDRTVQGKQPLGGVGISALVRLACPLSDCEWNRSSWALPPSWVHRKDLGWGCALQLCDYG